MIKDKKPSLFTAGAMVSVLVAAAIASASPSAFADVSISTSESGSGWTWDANDSGSGGGGASSGDEGGWQSGGIESAEDSEQGSSECGDDLALSRC